MLHSLPPLVPRHLQNELFSDPQKLPFRFAFATQPRNRIGIARVALNEPPLPLAEVYQIFWLNV